MFKKKNSNISQFGELFQIPNQTLIILVRCDIFRTLSTIRNIYAVKPLHISSFFALAYPYYIKGMLPTT